MAKQLVTKTYWFPKGSWAAGKPLSWNASAALCREHAVSSQWMETNLSREAKRTRGGREKAVFGAKPHQAFGLLEIFPPGTNQHHPQHPALG